MKTLLQIVKDCDNFPDVDITNGNESLWLFYLPDDSRPHGVLLDEAVQKIPWTPDFKLVTSPHKAIYLLKPSHEEGWQEKCNQAIDTLLDNVREQNTFVNLGKKRNEKYAIIGAKFPVGIERSAASLFGIIGSGVHMTVYTKPASSSSSAEFKFWIPKRNSKKATYPGMLDNTVAGGVAMNESPFKCLVREAAEEAALPESLVREHAQSAGTVTWFNVADERAGGELGLLNPGCLFVYDLEVPQDIIFKPVDGDISSFTLMDVQQVLCALKGQLFKPSSANVMIDFMVRHGIITRENEEQYYEIGLSLHRTLPFPLK